MPFCIFVFSRYFEKLYKKKETKKETKKKETRKMISSRNLELKKMIVKK